MNTLHHRPQSAHSDTETCLTHHAAPPSVHMEQFAMTMKWPHPRYYLNLVHTLMTCLLQKSSGYLSKSFRSYNNPEVYPMSSLLRDKMQIFKKSAADVLGAKLKIRQGTLYTNYLAFKD